MVTDRDPGDEHATQVVVPTWDETVSMFRRHFEGNANSLAMQFGGPVYLVGSFLRTRDHGDVDVRLVVDHQRIDELFGAGAGRPDWPPERFARAREELKQSRRLTRRWRKWKAFGRFDFQFLVTELWALDVDPRPRVRLDSAPDAHFSAGAGDP